MKKRTRVRAATIILAAGLLVTGAAQAGIPVFDVVNATSNVIQNFQLASIKHSLTYQGPGTINNHTFNIDKSIKFNTQIDTDFTWIIGEGGDEEVPIPGPVSEKMEEILGGQSSDDYAKGFQSASYYGKDMKDFGGAGVEGSRARKAANDALVKSIEVGQDGLKEDAELLEDWREMSKKAKGHGRQMQIANAFAGSQVSQMMKLRAAMLVSEASRAAEAQAAADKDARAIATGIAMREGLDDLRSQTIAPAPKY